MRGFSFLVTVAGMSLPDHPFIRNLLAGLGRVGRAQSAKSAPANVGRTEQMDPAAAGTLFIGRVTSSYAAGASVAVQIQADQPTLSCVLCSSVCGYIAGNGVVFSAPVCEGASVVVFKPAADQTVGYILAVLPALLGALVKGAPVLGVLADIEPGTGLTVEAGHIGPLSATATENSGLAMGGRPNDDMPGDVSMLSASGVGWRIGQVMLALMAGDRAGIELSQLDGMLRMVAQTFQFCGSAGQTLVTNDNGRTGVETRLSPYAHEVQGAYAADTPRTTQATTDNKLMSQAAMVAAAAQLTTIPRLQIFTGYLGSLLTAVASVPEAAGGLRDMAHAPMDTGVITLHADDSGRVRLTAAGDIILERCTRQPVPHRRKEQWDPTGDKAKDLQPATKLPFRMEPDAEHAGGRMAALHIEDSLAHAKGQDMLRLAETPGDIHLPEERDVPTPRDAYGGSLAKGGEVDAREEFKAYEDRHAIVRIGKDGTITARANNGGEITLTGEDIQLNCPGHIYLSAGRGVVAQAGQDIVLRARDSVDITASEHDVRLRAQRNLHASSAHSVLIESASESDDAGDWTGKGEDARHGGLAIRAPKSRVFVEGRTLHLSAVRAMIMESLDKAASSLTIRVANVRILTRRFLATAGGAAMLYIGRTIAGMSARSVGLFGQSSVMLTRGKRAAIIQHWGEMKTDVAAAWSATSSAEYASLYEEDAWLGGYGVAKTREAMRFTFRLLAQYGTDKAFYFPFAYWVYVWKVRLGRQVPEWPEREVDKTMPWPGAEHYEGAPGRELEEECNIDPSGLEKPRSDRQAEPPKLGRRSFNQFPRTP